VNVPKEPTVIAAAIALLGVLFSTVLSYFLARNTAKNTVRTEQTKRQSDLALKISESISSPDLDVRRAAMRRLQLES
jgi:hypothetical protein